MRNKTNEKREQWEKKAKSLHIIYDYFELEQKNRIL